MIKQRKTKRIRLFLIIIGGTVCILLAICVVSLLFSYHKYAALHDRVNQQGRAFLALNVGVQSPRDITSCSYISGTGLSGGGWSCGTSWHGQIASSNKDGIEKIAEAFKQSKYFSYSDQSSINDLYTVPPEPWYYDSLEFAPNYRLRSFDRETHVVCILRFVNNNKGYISISLSCLFGSLIPWYKIVPYN